MAVKKIALEALALAVHDAEIAVREVPRFSNLGTRVEQYQRTAGVAPPQPYCASAVYTWYSEACKAAGVANKLTKTGYCPTLANWGKTSSRVRKNNADAQPGDIIVYWLNVSGVHRFGHTGIVQKNLGDGRLIVVEANTNNDGSRDGDGVYFKTRRVSGTKDIVLNMQDWTVMVPDLPVPTPAPATTSTLALKIDVALDGVDHPEIDAILVNGHAAVAIVALATALKGKGMAQGEISYVNRKLEITTVK